MRRTTITIDGRCVPVCCRGHHVAGHNAIVRGDGRLECRLCRPEGATARPPRVTAAERAEQARLAREILEAAQQRICRDEPGKRAGKLRRELRTQNAPQAR